MNKLLIKLAVWLLKRGRILVKYPKGVELSFQDDNRTLKIFI